MDAVLFGVFLHVGTLLSVQAETHSLYYMYTVLSKPVNLPGIYEFTAMGLLDDRQIDYYNNKEQKKIPKQQWMREKMPPDYWEKGTQSRKSKEQWFNVNVNILMERMKHNNSNVHVLQWRHGCEIKDDGTVVTFSRGIDQYSYDGDDFLSFDDKVSQWVAPVDAAVATKVKWDNVAILNQYTKGYLEKECVDWLNKFREYGQEQLKKVSPPEVHVFARKSPSDKNKLKLTCLATGFYPKDVEVFIRKYRMREKETESSGVRPNHDGTYQLRESVEIMENEKADYDCCVSHSTLKEVIVKEWDGKCQDCNEGAALAIGVVIGIVLTGAVCAAVGIVLYKKRKSGSQGKENNGVQVPLQNTVCA
ncbi:patr class I histocompatibility antigen, alpha chain E-like [Triplophysa rosa]|uniref:patr class I histocompatibility antigen, alpha chain E-like n=1 Tax=Triplophysa rosa TaxID=992332 RepID=UPI00254614D5|nr:patr class I histocompatibility antigen, alpha chain E-like [Triplophysa rosa]